MTPAQRKVIRERVNVGVASAAVGIFMQRYQPDGPGEIFLWFAAIFCLQAMYYAYNPKAAEKAAGG